MSDSIEWWHVTFRNTPCRIIIWEIDAISWVTHNQKPWSGEAFGIWEGGGSGIVGKKEVIPLQFGLEEFPCQSYFLLNISLSEIDISKDSKYVFLKTYIC